MLRGSVPANKGQALLLATVSLPVIFLIAGLAVDLGMAKFTRKTAQTAADSAALAAASQALASAGQSGGLICGHGVSCQSLASCPATGNLQNGCLYAEQNGFTPGGAGGQQTVQIAGGTTSPAPGAPSVPGVLYWTEATAGQTVPQLFSSFFGNSAASTGAYAMGAILPKAITPSLFLLNRTSDCFVSALALGLVCGEDFLSAISARVDARGGIYMASSNSTGIGLPNVAAGTIVGAATVTAPYTYILGNGGISTLGASSWSTAPENEFPDGDNFKDPMRGMGQPPAPSGLTNHPVAGGVISAGLLGATKVLAPGNYYATNPLTGAPLGTPVTLLGKVVFSDGAATPCGGFCNYVFFGGLVTGALSSITFSPGEYVFAGSQAVAGAPGIALSLGVSSSIRDLTPLVSGKITQNTDAGEIFVFTDMNYPGLTIPPLLSNAGLSLPQVTAGFQGGLGYSVTLHGLNSSNSAVPAGLTAFAPVLIWQDQANTTLSYTSNGSLDLSCGSPCTRILSVPGSQQMIIQASTVGGEPGVNLLGTIYAPRAAWITELGLLPTDTIRGPLQIIAGALEMAVDSNLDVTPVPVPLTRRFAALIR